MIFPTPKSLGQAANGNIVIPHDTIKVKEHNQIEQEDVNEELDLIDVGRELIKKEGKRHIDTSVRTTKIRISAIPAAGYTLQTGFAALISGNAAYFTDTSRGENESVITSSITYSQYSQIILPIQANLWSKGNKYNIVIDWRYLKYPSLTYGLGGLTTLEDGYTIDYSALRLHQTFYIAASHDIYFGVGYDYDYFWKISELDPPAGKESDFEKYGLSNTETGSGPTINFLYDSRKNPINPKNGSFLNIIYRPNWTFLGNNTEWHSLIIDARKYIKLPIGANDVLAFWSYDWLTLSGNPPYLLLPNTGGDPSSNTGRGYIQGRFRSKNMLYLEGEYRFGITRNGFLGGVLFANAESFSDQHTGNYSTIAPGYGAGIRIKLNKFSGTNLGLDYGFGTGGSGGFFVNLGEVF